MSRTKKGRDALRSSEAHPQTRSIAPSWPERSQGRVPIGRYRPKSAETGETHPLPGAGLRPVRRRGAALLRWQPPPTNIVLALRQGSSTKSTNCVEKLCLIAAPVADSLLFGAGDSADDGRAARDAGGAVLRLQPRAACPR